MPFNYLRLIFHHFPIFCLELGIIPVNHPPRSTPEHSETSKPSHTKTSDLQGKPATIMHMKAGAYG